MVYRILCIRIQKSVFFIFAFEIYEKNYKSEKQMVSLGFAVAINFAVTLFVLLSKRKKQVM